MYGVAVMAGSDNAVTGLILTSINLLLVSGLIWDIIIASLSVHALCPVVLTTHYAAHTYSLFLLDPRDNRF